jgi:hypothetical protein
MPARLAAISRQHPPPAQNVTGTRHNQNAWPEDARRNRSANFLLRHALGVLARLRHAACPRLIPTIFATYRATPARRALQELLFPVSTRCEYFAHLVVLLR